LALPLVIAPERGMSGVWELFEKIQILGEGSYGAVYLAVSKDTKKLFAIKLLKTKVENSKYCDIPYTSLREVSILKDLDHPNVVK
jgi:serine/threonine protein kinase